MLLHQKVPKIQDFWLLLLPNLFSLLPDINGQQNKPKILTVRSDAPVGWLVSDLVEDGYATRRDHCSLHTSNNHSQYFQIIANRLYTRQSIKHLSGRSIGVVVQAAAQQQLPQKRIFALNVNIAGSSTARFSSDVYRATVRNDAAPETVISFGTEITVVNTTSYSDLYISVISNSTVLPFVLVQRRRRNVHYAQLYLTRRLRQTDGTFHSFYIGALDRRSLVRVAVARIDISLEHVPTSAPRFDTAHYFKRIDKLPPHTNVLRVTARASRGAVVYRIEPESVPFDVTPFSGDVFSRYGIPNGRYVFDVIATDSRAQEARANVRILVGPQTDPKRQFKRPQSKNSSTTRAPLSSAGKAEARGSGRRSRRDLADDIVLTLKENHPLGMLQKKIDLDPDERILLAPVTTDYLRIHGNGSIELIRPLNYEFEMFHQAAVQISSGQFKARTQVIRIEVLDVDEPPTFQNGPRPYQAVVAYDQPVGMHVYKFVARDEAGDGDDDVEYRLINTEPSGTFTVDPLSGTVQTAVKHYKPGQTYRIFVQARDRTPTDPTISQDSEVAVLEVYAGDRAPQFIEQHYTVHIPEDTEPGSSVVDVKAERFKPIDKRRSKGELLYQLFLDTSSVEREPSVYFTIDAASGLVRLKKELDHDDDTQPKHHQLRVIAREDNKESTVPLDIYVKDVNDNAPVFTQPIYSATTKEDVTPGRTILTVQADDKDRGENARITYSLSDGNFSVTDQGEISARTRLDADQNRERFFIYRFNVTATDHGEPPLSTSAVVHIRTENTNDEAPTFIPTRSYHAYVAEDAQGGTPVVQIQAIDPDRDQVFYSFLLPTGQEIFATELFEIDRDTGLIRLGTNVKPEDLIHEESPYNLTVLARDDGSCCGERKSEIHTQTATVSIDIADVNNNKPEFRDCDTYSSIAKIEEGDYKTNAPVILKVVATDEDSPPNGEIVYSLYYSQSESRKPFIINPETGELKPSPFVRFDREQRAHEEVTVKATDKGERPLIGFCQFTVQVLDVNDNAPQFDRASYETSISRSVAVGYSVVTVFADDADAPQNARITYSLAEDTSAGKEHRKDFNFFRIINENSGEITLVNQIPSNKDRFVFNVVADDNGKPLAQRSTVQVVVNVHEKQQSAPQWQTNGECRTVVTVDEDIPVNSVLLRCLAIPGDGSRSPISYKMANGASRGTNNEKHFREFLEKTNGRDWVVVRNMIGLDYEQQQNYTLTLTAMDMRSLVTSDKQFHVIVQDKNDVVPRFTVDLFTGTIEEEQTPTEFLTKHNGNPITVVKAEDADSPGPQSEIRYRIIGDSDTGAAGLFRIDELTGGIFPLEMFDREKNDSFIFDVEARDSAPSSLPGSLGPNRDIVKVQIFVADINDNAPYFEQPRYEARIAENAEINQDVITVKAHDLDRLSNLKYDLYAVYGGRIPFGVRTDSGALFVKEPLDYEKENVYHMKLLVTDGKHNATTDLYVYVDDVNDNAPQFEKNLYEITISEEDYNVPKTLFVVKATDADKQDGSSKIVYRLEGQGVGEFFQVDRYNGNIQVIRPLDRDPPAGVPVWKFIVQAVDDDGRGLIGYADVQVNLRDINDNAPVFASNLFGTIDENRDPGDDGVFVMTVTATDYDDPRTDNARLEYSIAVNKEIDGEPVFRIVPHNGKIYAMRKMDRELPSEKQFVIEVRATDKGTPPLEGTGNVTIRVTDVNDNEPYFEKQLYFGSVAETAPIGSPVMSVSALDKDTEARDNIFSYELMEEHQYFYITTEADSSSSSVGVLRVKKPLDYEDPAQRDGFTLGLRVYDGRYYATTKLYIELQDRNDNPPVINGPQRVQIPEDAWRGQSVARFTVQDADANDTAVFRINRQTDPKRQFSIDQSGSLRVAQRLDREEIPKYNLIVEAFDSAGNVGFQTIEIYVQDVNDNAPVPYTVPNPCVFMENTDPSMQPKCEIRAYDPDTIENGPPFSMKLAPDFKYGAYLNVVFNKNGDNGNGSMTVTAKQRFDREAEFPGKELEIPIILKDCGGLQSERSVYIIIGDENDSPMRDGQMTIFVNSYLGHLGKTVIGRVYVEDKDDWDLPDKVFTWAPGKSLPGFSLATNGEITMDADMPARTYQMTANVVDKRRNEKAQGVVNVIVKLVPAAAFENQGALRILLSSNGLDSPGSFIRLDSTGSSPMIRFVNKMNDYLDGNSELDVFSIKQDQAILQNYAPPVLDVRFSARGSPYKSSTLLNGLIAQHRDELQQAIGATIVSAGIDMCKFTVCDKGCRTVNYANEQGVVVSANQTVIVGVNAWSNDTCVCPVFTPPQSCEANLCLNSGVCHDTYPGFFCECRNSALKGFRCQGTTRSFDGQGYAWFKPVPACTSLNISLQFLTRQSDGLLLYNGPMGNNNTFGQADYKDYVVIRLVGGRIQAEMMFNGIVPNPIQVPGSDALNDGKWHTVRLTQDGKLIELVIDNCYTIVPIGTPDHIIGVDDSSCRRVKVTADDDERLNVVAPLQVGGIAPLYGKDQYPGIVTAFMMNFKGCIRNLVINNEMYDLGVPDYVSDEHSQMGCQLTEAICGMNDISGPYCVHGECIADLVSNVPKCLCDPGYGGDRCNTLFKWVEFGPGSFVEYDVKVGLEDKTTDVDVLFLPGRASAGTGELGFAEAAEKYISTSMVNYSPNAKFDLSSGTSSTTSTPVQLQLNELRLQDNTSYWMHFSRSPVRASLSVDGVYHDELPLNPLKVPYQIDISELLLGAQSINGAKGFRGCVGTFRWQHINLPLQKNGDDSTSGSSSGSSTSLISVKQSKAVESGCSQRKTCANVGFAYCGGSFVCVDFWKGPFCTCPEGAQVLLGANGELVGCGETLAVSSLGISSPAIILILICLILLIMLVLLMVVYTRRQTPPFEPVRPEDLNRDNLRPYDVEGGGEADNDQYNIVNLRKPVMPIEENGVNGYAQPVYPTQRAPIDDKLNSKIKNLEADPDATAPYDELRIYDDEGDNISRVTLESLESVDDANGRSNLDQEIEKWGPRFNNLADIYGKREK